MSIHTDNKNFMFQGRTFASLIQNLVQTSRSLEEYLAVYETPRGREVYDETLAAVNREFPQYVKELEGTADGAQVPFHKVLIFLLISNNYFLFSMEINGA